MKIVNRVLRRFGAMLAPLPPSGKMLIEHANVCESQHLASDVHGNVDGCTRWMRRVAAVIIDVR